MHFCANGLKTFERSDVAAISTDGDRFELKPVESEISRELIQLGAVSPRLPKRNVLVPFSTFTVKYLLGLTQIRSCEEESDWFQLEKTLEEITSYAKKFPVIRSMVEAICDHMLSTLNDQNCFILHKKLSEFDCEKHVAKTLEYIKYNLVRMVVFEKTVDVEFFRLTAEDLQMLLNCDDINLDKEIHIAEVVNKWISANFEMREKFRPILISSVRVNSLTQDTAGMFADFNLSLEKSRKTRDVLLVIGGWLHKKACNRIEWFDPELNVWNVSQQTLPMELAYHGAAVLDDHLYVFGGSNGQKSRCETWKCSAKAWRWERCDNMLEPRNYISNSSVVYDGKIYVFGGQNWREISRTHQRSATGEVYDPKTDKWTSIASLHDMRSDCAAAVYYDQIFISGGFNGVVIMDTVEIYNPSGDFFVRHVSLPYPLSGHCMIFHADRLHVIGGFNGVEREKRILMWHHTGEWKHCDQELVRSRSTSSACSYKGSVISVGGYTSKVESSCETLLSGPNARFQQIPPILRAKSALKVVVAPNWRAYLEERGTIVGGFEEVEEEDSRDGYTTTSAVSMSGIEAANNSNI
uniref:BACK domain-containing protein n=1 Tax=Caenorhabditis japonica TaxID=281687 RepID=A0A8R1E2E4_CAEJA